MQWDPSRPTAHGRRQAINCRQVDLAASGGTAYYVYDAAGQRVRKVTGDSRPGSTEERIYLGGFEIYRKRNGTGAVTLERETLHIMDDKQRIALVETRTQGEDDPAAAAAHPLPVRQPPRLGQPGAGRPGADHFLRGVHPLRQHVVSGGAQPDRDAEALSLHGQGAG